MYGIWFLNWSQSRACNVLVNTNDVMNPSGHINSDVPCFHSLLRIYYMHGFRNKIYEKLHRYKPSQYIIIIKKKIFYKKLFSLYIINGKLNSRENGIVSAERGGVIAVMSNECAQSVVRFKERFFFYPLNILQTFYKKYVVLVPQSI